MESVVWMIVGMFAIALISVLVVGPGCYHERLLGESQTPASGYWGWDRG